ncbi:MAG: class I SAM-dependent methyltransferase, partial [Gemmatimonadetes bacterium]|nr:class I SAM-dependent methyltransferase [Gemmatimonadota bacterium]
MASSLAVARHRATRFGHLLVVDLCCGIGGDLMALAERGPCVGVDVDLARLHMARANVESMPFPAHLVAADATYGPVSGNAAVVDPARRQGSRRVRSGADYEPSLQLIE